MKKTQVKANPTKLPSKPPKQWNRLLGYSWKNSEPDHDALKDLGQRLRNWSLLEDSLRIEDFLDLENVATSSFHLWKNKYEDLKEANDFALRRIASRRWKLSFLKTADRDIFKLDQHLYDPNWGKEVNEYWANLRKQDMDQQGDIHVHIDAVPKTDQVPEKKDKE